jgi:NlpC/P60 family putative phage cell wall peptidase
MTARQEVVQEARAWLGTPYHHQGRVKGAGVDCAMLLIEVFRACGLIPDVDPKPYPPDWHLHRDEERYLGWVKQYARPVEVPQPGDIALFQFGRCVSHGAIVLEWPTVVHSYLRDGCILADATAAPLGGRLRGFYSIFKDQA